MFLGHMVCYYCYDALSMSTMCTACVLGCVSLKGGPFGIVDIPYLRQGWNFVYTKRSLAQWLHRGYHET